MAFTQDQLSALEVAIASGELTVKYRDREITYRSSAELMRAYQLIKEELDTIARNPASVVRFV